MTFYPLSHNIGYFKKGTSVTLPKRLRCRGILYMMEEMAVLSPFFLYPNPAAAKPAFHTHSATLLRLSPLLTSLLSLFALLQHELKGKTLIN